MKTKEPDEKRKSTETERIEEAVSQREKGSQILTRRASRTPRKETPFWIENEEKLHNEGSAKSPARAPWLWRKR